jgi:hypothetical protein
MTGQERARLWEIRQARPGFYQVASRLTGELHEVKVSRNRFVGLCTCGAETSVPWAGCEHHSAVRRHLMDRYFRREPAAPARSTRA